MTTSNRFDQKDPNELIVLTFDFSPGLAAGETLTGTPTVTITTVLGVDATPSSVLAGGNTLGVSNTAVLVPVKAGIDACDYDVVVRCATSNSAKTLVLGGILPVRAQ